MWRRSRSKLSDDDLRTEIERLRPWYQNVQLRDGVSTKNVGGATDIFSDDDIPAPLWSAVTEVLDDLEGKRVLDIGCNAGYMSFASKRLGASTVIGIDSDLGATTSFLDQARFCREVLGLDVEFVDASLFEYEPDQPFDVVLFCGVLYHLENWATGLARTRHFVRPGGQVILETAVEPTTLTLYGTDYLGDATTFFVPSPGVVRALAEDHGFAIEHERLIGTRSLLALRA